MMPSAVSVLKALRQKIGTPPPRDVKIPSKVGLEFFDFS
jgi:hypothetical protein